MCRAYPCEAGAMFRPSNGLSLAHRRGRMPAQPVRCGFQCPRNLSVVAFNARATCPLHLRAATQPVRSEVASFVFLAAP